jgi:hypothetical protein
MSEASASRDIVVERRHLVVAGQTSETNEIEVRITIRSSDEAVDRLTSALAALIGTAPTA